MELRYQSSETALPFAFAGFLICFLIRAWSTTASATRLTTQNRVAPLRGSEHSSLAFPPPSHLPRRARLRLAQKAWQNCVRSPHLPPPHPRHHPPPTQTRPRRRCHLVSCPSCGVSCNCFSTEIHARCLVTHLACPFVFGAAAFRFAGALRSALGFSYKDGQTCATFHNVLALAFAKLCFVCRSVNQ